MVVEKFTLDIGAADSPAKEATHAMDILEPDISVEEFKKKNPHIKEYWIAALSDPPKEAKGKFSHIISRHALAAFEDTKASKGLAFLSTPDATAEITVDLNDLSTVTKTLHEAGFEITQIKTIEQPAWVPVFDDVKAHTIIYAKRGLKPSQSKYLEMWDNELVRFPIPIRQEYGQRSKGSKSKSKSRQKATVSGLKKIR